MPNKIYRCKVWTAAWIHFRAQDEETALSMVTRYFADKQEISVEYVKELEEGETDEDLIFDEEHIPNITIN